MVFFGDAEEVLDVAIVIELAVVGCLTFEQTIRTIPNIIIGGMRKIGIKQ